MNETPVSSDLVLESLTPDELFKLVHGKAASHRLLSVTDLAERCRRPVKVVAAVIEQHRGSFRRGIMPGPDGYPPVMAYTSPKWACEPFNYGFWCSLGLNSGVASMSYQAGFQA
jgi:hypothetical protein